jgi:hypothetical protein
MTYRALSVAVFFIAGLSSSVHAECNSVCRRLCNQDPGDQTVANCIRLWSCINEKYGRDAMKFAGKLPPRVCRHLYKPKK